MSECKAGFDSVANSSDGKLYLEIMLIPFIFTTLQPWILFIIIIIRYDIS